MRKFVIALSLIFPVFVITNCSQPIGTLKDGSEATKYTGDPMWLVPRRQLYQIDERFKRYEDFQILMVNKGEVVEVKPDAEGVEVEISKDINLSTEFHDIVDTEFYAFHKVGMHIVTVNYMEKSAWYSIEVFSPNNGNSIGGDGGIGIIWAD